MQEITLYLTHISKIDRVNKSVNAGEVTKHQNKYFALILLICLNRFVKNYNDHTSISTFKENYLLAGAALECYHCHQTSTECINGVKKYLQTTNCTENKCFVLKYESKG